mgnify:CR=1 FL=1
MTEKNWVSVSMPGDLIDEIDELLKAHRKWASRAEFIRESVRRQIEQIKSEEVADA